MKKLSSLFQNISDFKIYGQKEVPISGIFDDSRKVEKNGLFIAISGLTVDGHKFIFKAIENGAKVVVGEKDKKDLELKEGITYIKVNNSRKTLGLLASSWYGNPSKKLKIVGVTGTDGKTTTCNLIYEILKKAGKKVGLISTINAKIGNKEYDTGFHVTNPEPILLQKLLFEMTEQKCEYAVLEVTSHGLDQERVAGVIFHLAVLTNITHEHLDYHKTFENYRNAKLQLFKKSEVCILNMNDPSYNFLVSSLKDKKIFSYGIDKKADFEGTKLKEKSKRISFFIRTNGFSGEIKLGLMGKYNVVNALAAIGVARYFGISWSDIKKSLLNFKSLTGRLEEIKNNKGITIFVDFAHTPNALESILKVLKSRKKYGKLICVFGCAGERDIEKRRIMPKISINLADISVFTAEDPRSEKIEDILKTMADSAKEVGGKEDLNYFKIPERGEAIYFAINKLAFSGDTVVICGKGHEKSMSYNGVEYPWSDQEAVKKALKGKIKKIKIDEK